MTSLDWQKDRTRQRMMQAAANRLPNPIRAAYDGQCPECQRPYHRGDRIGRVPTGWAHHACSIGISDHQQAQARRQVIDRIQ